MEERFRESLEQIIERLDPALRAQGSVDVRAMIDHGVEDLDGLIDLARTRTADVERRAIACWLLGRLGEPKALWALLSVVDDEHAEVRSGAARALGELGGDLSVESILASMLDDPQSDVRMAAAYALGLRGGTEAIEQLINMAVSPQEQPDVRGMAVETLADLRDRRAVPTLIELLNDPAVEVRYWAAFALGEIGDPAALPALRRVAASDDAVLTDRGAIRDEASAAIAQIEARSSRRNVLGTVREGAFHPLWPRQSETHAVRLTRSSPQAGVAPEQEEITLWSYEGSAMLVSGDNHGEWIYSARIIERAGPIVTLIVMRAFGGEEPGPAEENDASGAP